MNKLLSKNIKLLLTIFLIVRVCIDIFRGTILFNFEIFGISLLESINILFLLYILYLTIFVNKVKVNKKNILYGIIFLIYTIVHSIYVCYLINETSSLKLILSESYYIFRSYGMPILYLILLILNKYNKTDCKKLFIYLITIISGSIIITNITGLSVITYEANYVDSLKNTISNIFTWPLYINGNYELLTSKGLFFSGNGMSALLFMALPITYYLCYKNQKNNKILILLFIQLVSMLMLGTRVSTYGSLIITLGFIIYIILNYIVNKTKYKQLNKFGIILTIFLVIFIFSPGLKKELMEKNNCIYPICSSIQTQDIVNSENEVSVSKDITKLSDDEFIELIKDKKTKFEVPDSYYKIVPIEENIDFWRKIFTENDGDWRSIKNEIMKFQLKHYNLEKKNYLGMGYISKHEYVETDYTSEYYLFGIFGVIILLGPFISLYAYIIYKYIKLLIENKRKLLDKSYILLSGLIGLSVGFVSGHVFYQITTFYFLAFTIYICYIFTKVEK